MNPEETKIEVLRKFKNLLVESKGCEEDELVSTANLHNDLGLDSLDHVELIMDTEKLFDIVIPDEEAEKLNTIEDMVDLICKTKNI